MLELREIQRTISISVCKLNSLNCNLIDIVIILVVKHHIFKTIDQFLCCQQTVIVRIQQAE